MLFTRWKTERSSQKTVAAAVVGKREHISRQAYCRTCAVQPSEMVTSFYVTFRLESGESLELQVTDREYGVLCEGDKGMLTFQGTKFLSFART